MLHGRPQNRKLARPQVGKVFRPQSPFDFRVARQGSRAGTRHINQDTVELDGNWKIAGVRGDYPDILLRNQLARQSRTMCVQLDCHN